MMIAVHAEAWLVYLTLSDEELTRALLDIAAHIDPKTLRKHPRGPKKKAGKGYVAGHVVRAHVSTARVLAGHMPAGSP